MLNEFEITSELLTGPRKAWVRASPEATPDCLIFLDAELYIDRVKAPEVISHLQAAGKMGQTTTVYFSYGNLAARHVDFTCNENYASFLAEGLPRWIEKAAGTYERYFLCGLSLSALAAAFTVLRHPGVFAGALCQSPSAWWNDEWLARSLQDGERHAERLWISVGDQELQTGVSHPPTGLFQGTSQLESVRRLAAKLTGTGNEVHFTEYDGGHDPACWAKELPGALQWLTRRS